MMHIVGPWLTNTNTKKRQQKVTKSQQEEIERGWRERNARLKEMGLPKETIEQYAEWLYGRGKKEKKKTVNYTINEAPVTKARTVQAQDNKQPGNSKDKAIAGKMDNDGEVAELRVPKSLGLWITGPVSSKPAAVYTGTKVKGIGTMHKSNAVPIFSDEEAVDISRMRR
jgi:hypothetical protein